MLSRRHFLSFSGAAGAGAVLNTFQSMAQPLTPSGGQDGYRLLIFATNWGYSGSWEEFASRIKSLGYDGAELWYPSDPKQRNEIFSAFRDRGLQLGFLIGSGERVFEKHLSHFRASLEGAIAAKPVY